MELFRTLLMYIIIHTVLAIPLYALKNNKYVSDSFRNGAGWVTWMGLMYIFFDPNIDFIINQPIDMFFNIFVQQVIWKQFELIPWVKKYG